MHILGVIVSLQHSMLLCVSATVAPNIVVIVCDSMDGRLTSGGRYDGVVDLPNLETLSERGTTYLNAYTNNPICVPSRSALWSGMHSHITESWNNYKGLPIGFDTTWEDRLRREAKYATKILGKVDFHSGAHSLSNRVEAWTRNVNFTLRQEGRPAAQLTGTNATIRVNGKDWPVVDEAVQYINGKSADDTPFMLYVGLTMPHPYASHSSGQKAGASTFKTSLYWLEKVNVDKIHIPTWLPRSEMHPVDVYSTIVKNCSSEFSMKELIDIKTYFYAMCAETDAMVEEIIKALERNHLSELTYIIFTSDHGELAMEHRQFYKMSMYEGSSHVPLIVVPPKMTISQEIYYNTNKRRIVQYESNVVSLIDIFPTLMDIAGLDKPYYLNGTSLFNAHPAWILSQYHGCNVNASTYMIRLGPWKYIKFDDGPEDLLPMIFNLDDDPDELHNLASVHPNVVKDFNTFLRSQIDYASVTRKVREYNKQSFVAWRNSEVTKYDETIANLRWWMDWQKAPDQNQMAIDNWLNNERISNGHVGDLSDHEIKLQNK